MPKSATIKAKAREWEKRVAAYLQSSGWPLAERRRPGGSRDKGDIAGVLDTVIEAKNEKDWGSKLAQYQDEALEERENAEARHSVVVIPRKNKPIQQAYAITTLKEYTDLLRRADRGG